MTLFTPMVDALLQAASDSGATRIVVERGWLSNVASVGQALVSLLVMIMLALVVAMLFALKKSLDELAKLVKNSAEPVRGVLQEAREVTSELRSLTQTVRGPVTRIVETVDDAGQRVRHAMVRAEDRLARLDALVGVVQEEAEEVVIRTTALARGMRVGTSALRALFFRRAPDDGDEPPTRAQRLRKRRALEARARLAARRERNARHEGNGDDSVRRERRAPKDDTETPSGPRIRARPRSTT